VRRFCGLHHAALVAVLRILLWYRPMQLRSAAILILALGAVAPGVSGQEDLRASRNRRLYSDRAAFAAEGALRWLAARQNRADGPAQGSWNSHIGFKINDGYRLQPQVQEHDGLPHLGVTALAGMAFLSGGHLPGQGPYGAVLERALAFVRRNIQESGYITANGTRMYSHAFCLLFLAEVYGMTGRDELRRDLDRAVEFTYKSQNKKGGWRYAPLARDSDMSITVCQVVALREARNIGIKVPKKTIDLALRYVMESSITEGPERGAFLYQHKDVPFNRNSFALTAAGLTTIYQAGLYSDREVARFCRENAIRRQPRISHCLTYLRNTYEPIRIDYSDHYFYFYGNYYAAQAMYTRGGEDWRSWYEMVRDDLLHMARTSRGKDGREVSWRSQYVGDAFSTAIAAIVLQVPKNYLPIFQR